jgi:hypothetical protein
MVPKKIPFYLFGKLGKITIIGSVCFQKEYSTPLILAFRRVDVIPQA